METLKNAERAAGFAMASSDELSSEGRVEPKSETVWRPSEAAVLRTEIVEAGKTAPSVGERVKSLLGIAPTRATA